MGHGTLAGFFIMSNRSILTSIALASLWVVSVPVWSQDQDDTELENGTSPMTVAEQIDVQEQIEKIELLAKLEAAKQKLLAAQLKTAKDKKLIAEERRATAKADAEVEKMKAQPILAGPVVEVPVVPIERPAVSSIALRGGEWVALGKYENGEQVVLRAGLTLPGGIFVKEVSGEGVTIELNGQQELLQ